MFSSTGNIGFVFCFGFLTPNTNTQRKKQTNELTAFKRTDCYERYWLNQKNKIPQNINNNLLRRIKWEKLNEILKAKKRERERV